jgi:amino acid adenylation domain-containing protein
VTMHHIASDDWSWTIFIRELAACYSAIARGGEPQLPELPVSYGDYAAYQRASIESPKMRKQIAYWTDKLSGTLPTLDFPLDRARPQQQTDRGAREQFDVPSRQHNALRALAVREGATLFMALLAILKVLLHRYTGQEDLLVGTPIANRNLVETEGLIGFFANTLVIRSSVDGQESFLELLRKVRTSCLEAYENQDVPFEHIVEIVNPPRQLARTPLFDVQFALRNVPRERLEIAGLEIEELDVDPGTSKFDMFIFLREEGDELSLTIEYNSDLFLSSTIQNLGRGYTTLLANVVEYAEQPIDEIPVLDEDDRRLQLEVWNDTRRAYPLDISLHELVDRKIAETPDAVAIQFRDRQITYAELGGKSNAIADRLTATGIRPGDLVGVFVERSEHMVSALLGVLKAGAAFVPLDPYFPRDRIAFIVQDAGVRALVTDEAQRRAAEELHANVVVCDGMQALTKAGGSQPTSKPTLAYVLYTSGSTGQPKGVAVTHRNVVNFLFSMAERPGIKRHDTLLAVTTLSFDISILELFLPLTQGARVCIAARDDAMDPAVLAEIIDTQGVTILQATPATWKMLVSSGWKGSPRLKALCGGESFPRALANDLLDRVPEVWNMYGPTETTIWSSAGRVERSDSLVSIGTPIANTTLYVLDRMLEPVPIGAVGELHIGGAGVAAGYVKRDALTAQRFVSDPFSPEPGSRLYKTGDLARYRRDGTLECLGRTDNQVKIRGFRIELGEIEARLQAHEHVAQAAVTAAQRAPGEGFDSLVAHFVLHEPGAVAHLELRGHLRASLPEYMIPQYYNELDRFPLTPNNKIDRIALSRYRPPMQETDLPALETDSERYLAKVWGAVLGVEQIGRFDLFFEIGGHSLLAAQMVARIEKERGVRIPLREIILSNLSELAAAHLVAPDKLAKRPHIVRRLLDRVF